jgi:subtilase family serine protease
MGPLQSGPFNLHMICSGDKNREKRIPSLPRDAEWRFEFNFEYWFARSIRCKATVDKDNEVDERNEGNNERQISFKVILN